MIRERSYYLDIIRTLACIMVIVMHSPIPNTDEENSLLLGAISYFTAPCIGLFFMVSGALLLPIKDTPSLFLTKRLNKIIYPTLFWSLFYVLCNLITGKIENLDLVKSLLGLPFAAQGNGVLWFMYTLIGLYLLTPILSAWIEKVNERMIKLYLLFWTVTLCYPFIRLILDIPLKEENIFFYFSGYAGYFLLGYYLDNYNRKGIRKSGWKYFYMAVGSLIVFLPPILCKMNDWNIDFYFLFWYLSIGVSIMCIGWFVMIQSIPLFRKKNIITCVLTDFSRMSFGIYLIHIFIMRYILWEWGILRSLPYIVQIPLCTISTVLLSYLVVKWISKFPFSKYIIGC
ncbi:acyltransferase [Bacteroides faecium]|uniref:Acyltransferase n=1 Tax=Bacteroides faecium TaxID=2715212 RepID=A0A6H0KRV9_9BACE|nr:acyltransferase [Bacteroides faecium]QIU95147.1 acyltransferase [Bacteroides faecium]